MELDGIFAPLDKPGTGQSGFVFGKFAAAVKKRVPSGADATDVHAPQAEH